MYPSDRRRLRHVEGVILERHDGGNVRHREGRREVVVIDDTYSVEVRLPRREAAVAEHDRRVARCRKWKRQVSEGGELETIDGSLEVVLLDSRRRSRCGP